MGLQIVIRMLSPNLKVIHIDVLSVLILNIDLEGNSRISERDHPGQGDE